MFDVGFVELMVLGVLGLLILGPERLPGVAKTIGSWIGKARHMSRTLQRQIQTELAFEEERLARKAAREDSDSSAAEEHSDDGPSNTDEVDNRDHTDALDDRDHTDAHEDDRDHTDAHEDDRDHSEPDYVYQDTNHNDKGAPDPDHGDAADADVTEKTPS